MQDVDDLDSIDPGIDLVVIGPDGQRFDVHDVPPTCPVSEVIDAVCESYAFEARGRRPTVVADHRRPGETLQRINPNLSLQDAGLASGDELLLITESTAGGALEIVFAFLGGSTLIPLIQAFSTKAGEDLYAALRSLLKRHSAAEVQQDVERQGTVVLVDPDSRVVVYIKADQFGLLDLPGPEIEESGDERSDAWHEVRWDDGADRWVRHTVDGPPDVLTFTKRQRDDARIGRRSPGEVRARGSAP